MYKIENLKDFRKNDLSKGLDDQFYTNDEATIFYNDLIKDYGEDYILKLLDDENIGNCRGSIQCKNKYYSANELFHIKFLSNLKSFITIEFLKKV